MKGIVIRLRGAESRMVGLLSVAYLCLISTYLTDRAGLLFLRFFRGMYSVCEICKEWLRISNRGHAEA